MKEKLLTLIKQIKDKFLTLIKQIKEKLLTVALIKQIIDNRLAYLFIAPTVIGLLLLHFIPLIEGFYISFLDLNQSTWTQFLGAPWIGLRNYIDIFNPDGAMLSMGIGQALRNTFIYSIVVTLGSIGLGMLVAILLNRQFKGRGIVRSLFLTPWVVPQFVTGLLFGFMWQQSTGIINIILYDFLSINEWIPFISDTKPFWLMGDPLTLVAIIIPTIWRGFPHSMLMLMAGLTTISQDYYEAAEIDGANDWQKFWKITFPLLKPVWSILLLFGMIFNVYSFNIVIMMFGNGAGFPGDWGDLMMTNIFRNSFQQWNFGIGAAVSIVLMFIMMIAVSLWYRLYKQVEEG